MPAAATDKQALRLEHQKLRDDYLLGDAPSPAPSTHKHRACDIRLGTFYEPCDGSPGATEYYVRVQEYPYSSTFTLIFTSPAGSREQICVKFVGHIFKRNPREFLRAHETPHETLIWTPERLFKAAPTTSEASPSLHFWRLQPSRGFDGGVWAEELVLPDDSFKNPIVVKSVAHQTILLPTHLNDALSAHASNSPLRTDQGSSGHSASLQPSQGNTNTATPETMQDAHSTSLSESILARELLLSPSLQIDRHATEGQIAATRKSRKPTYTLNLANVIYDVEWLSLVDNIRPPGGSEEIADENNMDKILTQDQDSDNESSESDYTDPRNWPDVVDPYWAVKEWESTVFPCGHIVTVQPLSIEGTHLGPTATILPLGRVVSKQDKSVRFILAKKLSAKDENDSRGTNSSTSPNGSNGFSDADAFWLMFDFTRPDPYDPDDAPPGPLYRRIIPDKADSPITSITEFTPTKTHEITAYGFKVGFAERYQDGSFGAVIGQ